MYMHGIYMYGKQESSKGLIVMKLFQSIVILTECSTIYLRIFLRVFHYIQNYKYVKITASLVKNKCTSEFKD